MDEDNKVICESCKNWFINFIEDTYLENLISAMTCEIIKLNLTEKIKAKKFKYKGMPIPNNGNK